MIFSVHHFLGFTFRFCLRFVVAVLFCFRFGGITQLPCMARQHIFCPNLFYLEIDARSRRTTTICDWFSCPIGRWSRKYFVLILAFFICVFIRWLLVGAFFVFGRPLIDLCPIVNRMPTKHIKLDRLCWWWRPPKVRTRRLHNAIVVSNIPVDRV